MEASPSIAFCTSKNYDVDSDSLADLATALLPRLVPQHFFVLNGVVAKIAEK
jgi:hypothetical protein